VMPRAPMDRSRPDTSYQDRSRSIGGVLTRPR
jgi:hypothetical protein